MLSLGISYFSKSLAFFSPSLPGILVNGCFSEASWPQIVTGVWEGCFFFLLIHMVFYVSQWANFFSLFTSFFVLYHLHQVSFIIFYDVCSLVSMYLPERPSSFHLVLIWLLLHYVLQCLDHKLGYSSWRIEKQENIVRAWITNVSVLIFWCLRSFPSRCNIESSRSSWSWSRRLIFSHIGIPLCLSPPFLTMLMYSLALPIYDMTLTYANCFEADGNNNLTLIHLIQSTVHLYANSANPAGIIMFAYIPFCM